MREEIAKLDAIIEKNSQRKAELDKMFMSPDFKDLSIDEMNKLSREHEKISSELDDAELRWLELNETINES